MDWEMVASMLIVLNNTMGKIEDQVKLGDVDKLLLELYNLRIRANMIISVLEPD